MPKPHVVENPFSTRFVQPGEIPFLFVDTECTLAELAGRLQHLRSASIVGPHGVGKSTLCHALKGWFEQEGWRVESIQLQSGCHWKPASGFADGWDERTLVVVDGYEQLARWRRWLMTRLAKRRGVTLLTTVHRKLELPVLLQLTPALPVLEAVVGRLLDNDWSIVTRQDVADCFARHHDARETLFALYDIYQSRRRLHG
jgi:DNA polymerase III delta prime subunit